jgi:hypothetical protein
MGHLLRCGTRKRRRPEADGGMNNNDVEKKGAMAGRCG